MFYFYFAGRAARFFLLKGQSLWLVRRWVVDPHLQPVAVATLPAPPLADCFDLRAGLVTWSPVSILAMISRRQMRTSGSQFAAAASKMRIPLWYVSPKPTIFSVCSAWMMALDFFLLPCRRRALTSGSEQLSRLRLRVPSFVVSPEVQEAGGPCATRHTFYSAGSGRCRRGTCWFRRPA